MVSVPPNVCYLLAHEGNQLLISTLHAILFGYRFQAPEEVLPAENKLDDIYLVKNTFNWMLVL